MTKKYSSLTGATLRLTRQQYRELAEITKSFGMGLNLSTETRMGCWGQYSPWALLICKDASNPDTKWEERALITLANSINTEKLRAAGLRRPEVNWAALTDEEIYPFVVWHEIGHRMDNFDVIGMMIKGIEPSIRDRCHRRIGFINEVLADRYAWNKIRPNTPIPLTDNGKRLQEDIEDAFALLNENVPRTSLTIRPMAHGQYLDVPEYMLATPQRAAFIGPKVDKRILNKTYSYHRKRLDDGRQLPF